MKDILAFLRWDCSDIADPKVRNEIKANKAMSIGLFNIAILALIAMICYATNLWKTNYPARLYVCCSVILFFALSGSILTFVKKGRDKYAKYYLILDLILVAFAVDLVLTFNAALFAVVPILASCLYYDKKLTKGVGITMAILLFISVFLWPYTQAGVDINMLDRTVLTSVKDILEGNYALDYKVYVRETLIHSYMPRVMLVTIIEILATMVVKNGQQITDESIRMINNSSRITTELNLANDIQLNMLPNEFPAFPDIDSFDIYANMEPAKEVGGDLYDFFFIDDTHIALVVADVSGKGVPASLVMAITKTLLKAELKEHDIATACGKVNRMLCEGNSASLFVTAWVGIVDLNNGLLTFVNAGHNPPVIKLNNYIDFLKNKSGMAFGFLDNIIYKTHTVQMHPGDRLFIYTDGVTEAQNDKDELYGEERMLDFLVAHKSSNNMENILAMKEELLKYANGREQFDDITMLGFTLNHLSNSVGFEKEFPANKEELDNVIEFVQKSLQKFNPSMKVANEIDIAVEEIFVNIASYAYEEEGGKALVKVTANEKGATISFIDNGESFNPLKKADPNIKEDLSTRPIGGLGIFMVKKLMDKVEYVRENRQNILTITKNF